MLLKVSQISLICGNLNTVNVISLDQVLNIQYIFRILFHFHKNETTHVHAKVSPPRLNGLRTGVLGTRSPHRPSPIGLSLVQIDKVEGNFRNMFINTHFLN